MEPLQGVISNLNRYKLNILICKGFKSIIDIYTMAGGLLNLISEGANNVIIQGGPSQKTLFRATYNKITNFGLQKFRIDYDGLRDLRL